MGLRPLIGVYHSEKPRVRLDTSFKLQPQSDTAEINFVRAVAPQPMANKQTSYFASSGQGKQSGIGF